MNKKINKKYILLFILALIGIYTIVAFVLVSKNNVTYKTKAAPSKDISTQAVISPIPTVIPPSDYPALSTIEDTGLALLLSASNLPQDMAQQIYINGLSSSKIYYFDSTPGHYWYLIKGSKQFPPTTAAGYSVFYEPKKGLWLKMTNGDERFTNALLKNIEALSYFEEIKLIPSDLQKVQKIDLLFQGRSYTAMQMPSYGKTLEAYYADYKLKGVSRVDGKNTIAFIEDMYQQSFDNAADLLLKRGIVLKDPNIGNIAVLTSGGRKIAIPFDYTTLSSMTGHPYTDELNSLAEKFNRHARRIGLKPVVVSDDLLLLALEKKEGYVNFRVFLRESLVDLSFTPPLTVDRATISEIRKNAIKSIEGNPRNFPEGNIFQLTSNKQETVNIKVERVIKLSDEKIVSFFSKALSRLNVLLLFMPSIIEWTPSGTISLRAPYQLIDAATKFDYFIANSYFGTILSEIEKSQADMVQSLKGTIDLFTRAGGQPYAGAFVPAPTEGSFLYDSLINNVLITETEMNMKQLYDEFFQFSMNYDKTKAREGLKSLQYLEFSASQPQPDQTAWLYQNIIFLESIQNIVKNTDYPFPVYYNFNPGTPLDSGAYEYSKLSAAKVMDGGKVNIVFFVEKGDPNTKMIKAIYSKNFLGSWSQDYFDSSVPISGRVNPQILFSVMEHYCDIDSQSITNKLFQVKCVRQ